MSGFPASPEHQPPRQESDQEALQGRLVSLRRASDSLDIVLRDFKTFTEHEAA
jgi:hypothetical protein